MDDKASIRLKEWDLRQTFPGWFDRGNRILQQRRGSLLEKEGCDC